jgi:hypothetical protein
MKNIFFLLTFTILVANLAIAQNKDNQIQFPLKKSDYLTNMKKSLDSSWTFEKDEINFKEYSERVIKAEEEFFKNHIAKLKVALEKEFKTLSNNKNLLSKSDFVVAITKIEESKFDQEDTNKDGIITAEEHKAFLAKQKKTQSTAPAPKK